DAGQSQLPFKHHSGVYRTITPHRPEDAICYDEKFVFGLHKKYGLEVRQPVYYGSWCNRSKALSHQDVIVANKARKLSIPKPHIPSLDRMRLALRRAFYGRLVTPLRRLGGRSATTEIGRHVKARRSA